MYNKYSGGSNYNDYSNEIFTEEIYAGRNRSYFIIVKKDKNEQIYLTLKELKYNADDTKEVHRTMIFEADLGNFLVGLQNAVEFIKKDYPDAIVTRERPPKEYNENREDYQPRTQRTFERNEASDAPRHKFMKRGFDRPSPFPSANQSSQNVEPNQLIDETQSESIDNTSIISTKSYVAPSPTIITPKKIIEEPTIVDDKVTQEVKTKAPEKPIVTFEDMEDVMDLN